MVIPNRYHEYLNYILDVLRGRLYRTRMEGLLLTAPLRLRSFALVSFGVNAQTYPQRAIRIVVPYPPSGSSDILHAFDQGQKLSEQWKVPVVIENRPERPGASAWRRSPDEPTATHW